jgi:hypothetical protein
MSAESGQIDTPQVFPATERYCSCKTVGQVGCFDKPAASTIIYHSEGPEMSLIHFKLFEIRVLVPSSRLRSNLLHGIFKVVRRGTEIILYFLAVVSVQLFLP